MLNFPQGLDIYLWLEVLNTKLYFKLVIEGDFGSRREMCFGYSWWHQRSCLLIWTSVTWLHQSQGLRITWGEILILDGERVSPMEGGMREEGITEGITECWQASKCRGHSKTSIKFLELSLLICHPFTEINLMTSWLTRSSIMSKIKIGCHSHFLTRLEFLSICQQDQRKCQKETIWHVTETIQTFDTESQISFISFLTER